MPIAPVDSAPQLPPLPNVQPIPVSVALPPAEGITDETLYVQGIIVATAQIQAGVSASNNAQDVSERLYHDQLDYLASTYATAKQLEAAQYSADRQLEAANNALTYVNATEIAVRNLENQYRIQAAQIAAGGQTQAAAIGASADNNAAQLRYDAEVYQTDQHHIEALDANLKDYNSKVFSAQANKDASVFGSETDYNGRVYASDKSFAGQVYDADRQYAGVQLHEQAETARLQTKLDYANAKFNTVYPFVQSSLAAAQNAPTTPGLSFSPPFINTRGVYTPAQIQAQVNLAWARNDSRTQAQILQTQKELAGRGFSSNSPLLEALKVGYLGQNLRSNNEAATTIRLQSAQANADQTLKAQELLNTQFNQQQGVAIESEKNQVTRQVGLVGALASLIGGIT